MGSYIHYLTRCFFAPRLKMSTSALLRGIIGFGAPGAGLDVRDGGAELTCAGIDGAGAFGFEMIEEIRSEGLVIGRNGGEADSACGRGLAAACGWREEDAGLLDMNRDGAGFEDRGGEDEEAWGRDEGLSSNKSSASSKSSSASSSENSTKVSLKPPATGFGCDVKARSRASLSSNDGPLIPVIPPESLGVCFLDNILIAGCVAFWYSLTIPGGALITCPIFPFN